MVIRSVWINFNLQCRKCSKTLPVNRAAESIVCMKCGAHNSTSQEFWSYLITAYLIDATGMELGEESWAKGIFASIGSYNITFGRTDPSCRNCGMIWKIQDLMAIAEQGASNFICNSCGKTESIRKSPEWFTEVVPYSLLIIGETAPEATSTVYEGDTSVSIHCYHCGGNLKPDGTDRVVKCHYCGNDLIIPDDIWLRLHPVMTSHPWFILMDLGDSVALIPKKISDVTDIALLPGNEAVLLWDSHEGSCIGRTDTKGRFKWMIENITIEADARLFYVKDAARLWVIGTEEEKVLCFDAGTGDLVHNIENEEDPDMISVFACYGAVALSDNTIIIYRGMPPKTPFRMRRYDGEGKKIPLWSGYSDNELTEKPQKMTGSIIIVTQTSDWNNLPDRPIYPPDDALFEPGPDGTLYFIHPEKFLVAKYNSAGNHLETIKAKQKVVSEVIDAAVADDGSIFVVFEHRKKVGKETWNHLGVMNPDGSFEVLVGPYAPVHNYSIGYYDHKVAVSGRGSVLVCGRDFKYLWVFERDGSLIWQTPLTQAHDKNRADELKEEMGRSFFKRKK